MKHKSWLWWGMFYVAIIPVALFGPKLMSHLLTDVLEWMYQPIRYDSISQREYDQIEEQFGINIPETAKFIQNFHFPFRDPTDIYIFEMDASNKGKKETFDAYFRRILSVDDQQYRFTTVSDEDSIFIRDLEKVGLTYTNRISTVKADFTEIHYKVTDNNTIEVAFIIG